MESRPVEDVEQVLILHRLASPDRVQQAPRRRAVGVVGRGEEGVHAPRLVGDGQGRQRDDQLLRGSVRQRRDALAAALGQSGAAVDEEGHVGAQAGGDVLQRLPGQAQAPELV